MHNTPPPHNCSSQSRLETLSFRKAKALPAVLADECAVNFDEGLYSQAFSLLSSSLTAGTGSSTEAHVPPIQHLAFAATLTVHPQYTTRTTSPEKHAAANDALTYLRQVNSLTGPINAGLDKAFRFADDAATSRVKRTKSRMSDVTGVDDEEQTGRLNSPYAGNRSLWSNAADFWSILGWAFNCSVAHPQRWERWKLWLELILDVLENDLECKLAEATNASESGRDLPRRALLKDSLLTYYLSPIGQGRNNKRRVMRAILADGKQSLSEFGEIWKNETKPPKQNVEQQASKRRKLDLENGEFGDYFDESDEDSTESSLRRSRSTTTNPSAQRNGEAAGDENESNHESNGSRTPISSDLLPTLSDFGGIEAIALRQRVLALLVRYCTATPDEFLDREDLFDLYTEFLRPLPLPVFQQFVLPVKPYLALNTQASLNQIILRPLLVATAPAYRDRLLTQEEFEEFYALHAANKTDAVDNARVSLLVEGLLRLLWTSRVLKPRKQLRERVEQGIAARREKVAFDGRRKAGVKVKVEEQAIVVLECSGERMLMTLDMVELWHGRAVSISTG